METSWNTQSGRRNTCDECERPLSGDRYSSRFCSMECMDAYRKRDQLYNEKEGGNFSLSEEISRLHQLIIEQTRNTSDSGGAAERIDFYEQVIDRTSQALRWINTTASVTEQADRARYEEAKEEVNQLNQKLNAVLKKAVQLKKENRQLKEELDRRSNSRPKNGEMSTKLACTLLGVKEDTDEKTIKKAYRSKAKQTHPDREYGDADLFKALTDAMLLLLENNEDSE